ncbi:hypothetical protein PG993_014999 [Apiospora rasikravindrae]|uniref:Uncharacterized protein n=1 Tax=Apiospora rasikravindrae TaxID=990691 RepID=A0ABR1RPE6_9PEZI
MIPIRILAFGALVLVSSITAEPIPLTNNTAALDSSQNKTEQLNRPGNRGYACPATNNGPNRDYTEHTYTMNQAQAAMYAATRYQIKKGQGWQPTQDDYPHFFENEEKLPFDCGANKAEFPLRPDGQTFAPPRGDVSSLPDRVVYEFRWGRKETFSSKLCGAMRHGPSRPFLNCPEPRVASEDE